MENYVYLIEKNGCFAYKIGKSKTPELRLKQLSTASECDLIIRYKIAANQYASRLEKSLHAKYNHKRIRGEWYLLSDLEIEEFEKYCSLYLKNFNILSCQQMPI
jgi:hypothetical protein